MPNSFEDVYDSLISLGRVEIVDVKKRPQSTLAIVLKSTGSLCSVNCVISYGDIEAIEREAKVIIEDSKVELERKKYSMDLNKAIQNVKEKSGLEYMSITDKESDSTRSISHYDRVIRNDPLLDHARAGDFYIEGFANHPSGRFVACIKLNGRDGHLSRLYDKKKAEEIKAQAEKMLLRSKSPCKLEHLHRVKECLEEVLKFFP